MSHVLCSNKRVSPVRALIDCIVFAAWLSDLVNLQVFFLLVAVHSLRTEAYLHIHIGIWQQWRREPIISLYSHR